MNELIKLAMKQLKENTHLAVVILFAINLVFSIFIWYEVSNHLNTDIKENKKAIEKLDNKIEKLDSKIEKVDSKVNSLSNHVQEIKGMLKIIIDKK